MQEEKKKYEDNQIIVRKSNSLINAKFKSSLLENKIVTIALTRIEVKESLGHTRILARLYPGDIKRILGKENDTNIYKQLKQVAKHITGHSMVIEDGMGNFKSMAIITNANYIDKVLEIEFNREFKPYIADAKNPYTKLSVSVLSSFSRNPSFRLYELLSKEMYRSNKKQNNGMIYVSYFVSELKFMIGLANAEEEGVKRYIENSKLNVDWDYIYDNVVKEKSYENWTDLKKRVLLPAQEELAEKSDIRFEFEGIRMGGTKIRKIDFYIYPNEKHNAQKIQIFKSEDSREFIDEDNGHEYKQFEYPEIAYQNLFDDYIGHNRLTSDDLEILLKKANYDEETVRCAIRMADSQTNLIENYMGWLVRCIERGYAAPITIVDGSADKGDIIKEQIEKVHSDDTKQKVWEHIKKKEDFESFLSALKLDIRKFEVIYEDVQDRIDVYTSWKFEK